MRKKVTQDRKLKRKMSHNNDFADSGPSSGGTGNDEEDGNLDMLNFMETTMETGEDGDEGDYEGNLVEVEPEIYLDNTGSGEDTFDDFDEGPVPPGHCEVCRGPLTSHANGEPCDITQITSFGQEHFLDNFNEDSSSNMTSISNTSKSNNRKTNLGSHCPVCAQQLHKQHARDHVCWHFMDELKSMIQDPSRCPEPGCDYTGEKTENVARHLALFHSKLDIFLSDTELVEEKRQIAMSKPKKVDIGPSCVICGLKDPAREHVSRHFMKELMEIVNTLEDQIQCPDCNYRGEKPQNLARHIALVHSKLDELLIDEALVNERKAEFLSKPSKLTIGPNCPVCDQALSKQHSRVHVIWHFMEELRAIVATFSSSTSCDLCDYVNNNSDKIAKHIALGHSKLDELLQDEDLVKEKRAKALTKPKKESIGPVCPICQVRDPPREHVARHFGPELSKFVQTLPSQTECSDCSYKGEKPKNLELHIALVHGRLDFYLKDRKLIARKRQLYMTTPKKQAIGPQCPICDMKFTKSQNRDHVSWHFMDELREYVQSFDDPQKCNLCAYSSEKIDNLVKHVALGHSKLDELLQNRPLVASKRAKAMAKPKKIAIGPTCPVCDVKEPAREHVARHFSDELMEYVNNLPDPCQCNECEYAADKAKTLAIHVALVHGKLDIILSNKDVVALKRAKHQAKPKKQSIGPTCPVCDMQFTKNQNRDHVSWHYMDELRAIVNDFPDPLQCTQCPYTTDNSEKMVKHVALGHSMLDGFLQNEELLQLKRMKALSKPKKVALGPTCPVCDVKDPPREHVARHFSDELLDIVMDFPDTTKCTECSYSSDKAKNVAIHIALVHNILDQILVNEALIQEKREKHLSKPQKVNIGSSCPVCDTQFTKGQNRDHVCWHFMDELREIVMGFPDREACNECSYRSDKLDNLVKHVALGHSKLDELLQNEDLVAQKREIALSKPKKISIGPTCPVCDLKFTKGQNRDHVSWHFMDELRDYVRQTGYEKQCVQCYYTTDKLDNLVKHYALGHCKLDEFLQDEELVKQKRSIAKKKPKRISFGKDCPICGQTGRDRDHVARHFMNELMEVVHALPKKSKCNLCDYSNSRADYMAKHIALFHCKLDEFMLDKELVAQKKEQVKKAPKKVSMGENCIICNLPGPSREHVARHFLTELQNIVSEKSPSPLSCPECSFSAEKAEYVARHMGLVHCKMDELVMDQELVKNKIQEYQGSIGQAGNVLSQSPTPMKSLPVRESVRISKRQREQERQQREQQARDLQAQKQREAEEKRRKDEMEMEKLRKREEADRRRAELEAAESFEKEESAKRLSFSMSPVPSKKLKLDLEPKSILETSLLLGKPEPTDSLLKATLLNQSSVPKPSDSWSCESGMKEQDGSLQIKIKRTTPAKWQIKPKSEDNVEQEEHHEIEPDISHLMEISHDLGEEDNAEGDTTMDEAANDSDHEEAMVICPEVILDDGIGTQGLVADEFCELCGLELSDHEEECQTDLINTKKPIKYYQCPVCNVQDPSREHISRHFCDSLSELATSFPEPEACPKCEYRTPKIENLGIHTAIFHGQLEKCLGDKTLLQSKQNEAFASSLNNSKSNSRPTVSISGGTSAQISCPICDQLLSKSHSRDHIVWHFMEELRSMISSDGQECPQCNYRGEKSDNVARHLALFHGQLDLFLQDQELVLQKRLKCLSKPKKAHIGAKCPVCDFKDPPREHVSRHFMPELLTHLETLPDQLQCSECSYRGEKPQNLAKHIALVHSMLDELLRDELLVNAKRAEFLAKPKKVSIGDHCPVCELAIPKRDSRVHVIWHFMEDLREMVSAFADQRICDFCGYQNPRPDKMAKHLALGHSKLDELLMNEELVQYKKELAVNKPKKLVLGPQCPICDCKFTKNQNRDHVAWHFMDELREMVMTFEDPHCCPQCNYTSDKVDNLVKHIALGHSKLDELMQDQALVAKKRQKAQAKPKKISIGRSCPICEIAFTKQQNRDHVSCHFTDELRELAMSFPDPQACVLCEYTTDKMENMLKHLALGHSKLDEFLQDEELVAFKRNKALNKPKKFQLGPTCPICDMANPLREHVARHFMDELTEYVQLKMPDQVSCTECNFRGERVENLAKHVGLFHCKLDELLFNEEYVASKKEQYKSKLLEASSDCQCRICDQVMQKKSIREHTARHFMPELADIIAGFKRSNSCSLCRYTGKKESLMKHVALVHGKLDDFLNDDDLVEQKRRELTDEPLGAFEESNADSESFLGQGYDDSNSSTTNPPLSAEIKESPESNLKIVIKRKLIKEETTPEVEADQGANDSFKVSVKRSTKKNKVKEEFLTSKDLAKKRVSVKPARFTDGADGLGSPTRKSARRPSSRFSTEDDASADEPKSPQKRKVAKRSTSSVVTDEESNI